MEALIVDDQPSALMLMRAILDRAGYHVVECSHGEKAIDELSTGHFDLVIMDLNLPDISGMEVLQSPELAPRPCVGCCPLNLTHRWWCATRTRCSATCCRTALITGARCYAVHRGCTR